MNCREFEADVVDLARGAEMSVTAAARLRAHLDHCAGCAARFSRERQLTMALKAIAIAAPTSMRSAAIEEQLLVAFTAGQATSSRPARASRLVFATPAVRAWLAAAAVIVLAVAGWQGTVRWRSERGASPVSTRAQASQAAPRQTTAGAAAGTGAPSLTANAATAVNATTPEIAARAASRPAAAPGEPAMRPARTREAGVLQFVTLPTAIGLPALESGRIVRVGVPTAMLPAYGFEVAPDSQSGMVEADVLVGQDGQPRAIRFVTLDSEPRRRQ